MNKVIIFSAHPDDELLGVGGTLIKHVQNNDEVSVVLFTDYASSRTTSKIKTKKQLTNDKKKFSKYFKLKNIFNLGLEDQKFETYPLLEITKKIEEIRDKIKPNIIYSHHFSDLNRDHRIVTESVLVAFRPLQKKYKIILYETPSSTEYNYKDSFNPNYYTDIKKTINKKINGLYKFYNLEMRDKKHPRSKNYIKSLAIKRGGECGLEFAEAFYILRDYF
tara:strand:- start:3534 stop:4193 length:660 start_codon:yes stop_codon:yes gene_type:complete